MGSKSTKYNALFLNEHDQDNKRKVNSQLFPRVGRNALLETGVSKIQKALLSFLLGWVVGPVTAESKT